MASSSTHNACSYDVFLSFRGKDTRNSFTDHLYHNLNQAGICTFRDYEEINRGEELKPEIERAIKESRGSIIVLSKNYATSTWCLDELLLILKQRRECNHIVLPVFYHVKPTDVRKHKKKFAIKVQTSSRWTDHNVSMWKTALMQVADLTGLVLSGPETNFIKEIVDTVYNKLDRKEVHLPLNITGMTTRYKEIGFWLDKCNLEFLAIYGMGGSGKTTLAKYIYDSNRKCFEYVSFVEDIASRCEKPNGLLELQEQLLKDILGGKKRKIPGVSRGTCMIEEALQTNRALIVLDDIAGHSQLVSLLGTGEINAQSKIIFTTRENLDNWFDFPYWRCQKYEMRLLNGPESSELLCYHAFRSTIPKIGFEELVLEAVQCCEGNPLALEVLGSSLSKCNTVLSWRSQLNLFLKDMHSGIQGVLERSYNSLPYESEKELFLHIACFFIGKDMDYVVKILEPDYSAISGIQTLIDRCLLSVSPNKKLMMHRLLQEMGRNIVRQESTKFPENRSRVWLSRDSYKILRKGTGSKMVEGLALDMEILRKEDYAFKSSKFKTDALQSMDNLKLLQLNFAEFSGSYEYVSEDLRWLCWLGYNSTAIPADLYMGNLVAIDMSYSNLEVFEPPMVIQSLRILNLNDSHKLTEICKMSRIPNLESLILWNCYSLVSVCQTIEGLRSLALLNMTGCKNIFRHINLLEASTSSGAITEQPTFPFPFSLHRLFLKDCHLDCSDTFPLSFNDQPFLQYLNIGNSMFEFLPYYDHLKNLRVLDLSFCSKLKCLLCLPSTLAVLYVYHCESIEKITFQSSRYLLQEIGYEGCINLYEVEGLIKLIPVAKLDETDLGHMKWLKEYQNHEVCLVGDEITVGRSWHIQMLYEFNIMSLSLPDIKNPYMTPKYISVSSSLSFDVPLCPANKRLKGINVTFKYTVSGDECAWFCKISTTNDIDDLMYNPKVFGKPEFGKECIWLSYWPIGNNLNVGDTVHVYIVVLNGLEVHECGVSLVYSDKETMLKNMGVPENLGGDMSGFQLSTGAYYLCRYDFFELTEVGRLTPDWFRILVGDATDYTEVRGWRKTGRLKQMNPSFTELKTVRCIIHGPQLEDIYMVTNKFKLSVDDKTGAFTSSFLEEKVKSGTGSELTNATIEEDLYMITDNSKLSFDDINSPGRIMNSATGESQSPFSTTLAHPLRLFSLEEIQSATNNFDEELVLGKGEFGTVYKGQISSKEAGHVVAIKRFYSMSYKEELEFMAEINKLCKFRHSHLVSFIGYCYENKEKFLVYEYMSNGSLYHHLHNAHTPLSWVTRLKIAIGAAHGLEYLHTSVGTQHRTVHRDVKSKKILLDENWAPMLSGFGFSRVNPTNPSISHLADKAYEGTFWYLDPVYIYTGKLTYESDVYAFGVVLFELLSGKRVDKRHGTEQYSFVRWAKTCVKEGKLDEMVDSNIKGTISAKCLRGFIKIAERCVHKVSKQRPTMSTIAVSLLVLLELQVNSDRFVNLKA